MVRHICQELPGPHYFTPINEASYFAWAAGSVRPLCPPHDGAGVRAEGMLGACGLARHCQDPGICTKRSHRERRSHLQCRGSPACFSTRARRGRSLQRQGRVSVHGHVVRPPAARLGGSRACLDIVGINYYWTNQWELGKSDQALAPDDPRRLRLGALVRRVAQRYGGEVLVSETAALGSARADWIDELSRTAVELRAAGIKLSGMCSVSNHRHARMA